MSSLKFYFEHQYIILQTSVPYLAYQVNKWFSITCQNIVSTAGCISTVLKIHECQLCQIYKGKFYTHLLKKMISIISLTNFFITLCGVVLFKTNKQSWLQISSFTNSPGRLVLYVSEINKTMVLCIMTTVLTIGAQAGWHSRQRYLLIFVKHANH